MKCNTRDVILYPCPDHSTCVEKDASGNGGTCNCKQNFVFNTKYKNSTIDYCIESTQKIENNNQQQQNNAKFNSGNSDKNVSNDNDNMLGDSAPNLNSFQQKLRPKPSPHHVIAGILIPIILVFIVIGTVFVYKKLHITQRIRNIRRTRRSRPFYEDVMLGSNDNDDPPLI